MRIELETNRADLFGRELPRGVTVDRFSLPRRADAGGNGVATGVLTFTDTDVAATFGEWLYDQMAADPGAMVRIDGQFVPIVREQVARAVTGGATPLQA